MQTSTLVASLVGAGAVFAWRIRETQKPATARTILLPPLGMSTGLCMFIAPEARVPLAWAAAAFLAGALLLSYPLIATSTMTRADDGKTILLKRSRAFLGILLALVAVRLLARHYVEQSIDAVQTASLFFLLAYGMLVPWRVVMYMRYRKLRAAAV